MLSKLPVTCPVRRDVSGVAHRQQMKIRRLAHFIDNLEYGGLLARDPIRIYRIHDGKMTAFAKLPDDPQRVIEIAINRDNFRSVREGLKQFSRRDLSRR